MSHPPASHSCCTCTVDRSFCRLPDELCGVFDSLKTTTLYRRGEVLFDEAAICRSVFIVCTGSVKLVTGSTEGKLLLLRFAMPGEVLALAEVVRGGVPYDCTAVAAEPSLVAHMARETFLRFVGSYPAGCLRMTRTLSEQYKMMQRETKFFAFHDTSATRLARLLLEWSAERGELEADSIHIPLHVTHTDLAQSIGATRETVTRIFSDFHQRGILARTPERIVILKADELLRLAAY